MPKKTTKDQKKTAAKRIGVSSILLHNGEIAITAFEKGNDARVAIRTDKTGSDLPKKDDKRNIEAKRLLPQGFEVIGTAGGDYLAPLVLANPADRQGMDYLKLKPVLEKEFFDQEFPEDNVHIQIIHNILDIQKLLGIYVNDIIYAVNNLREVQDIEETPDILGLANPLNQTNINTSIGKLRDYLGFFGDAFAVPKTKDKNGKEKPLSQTKEKRELCEKIGKLQKELSATTQRFKQENIRLELAPLQQEVSKKDSDDYDKLAAAEANNKTVILSLYVIRQCSAHYKNAYPFFSADLPAALKKIEKRIDWNIIDNAYAKRISQINSNFLNQSKVNLRILFNMFPQDNRSEIIESYYRFAILKQGKNLGVNMKKLRETMLDKYYEPTEKTDKDGKKRIESSLKDPKHDSYRAKLYAITDYVLFRLFGDSEELQKMVGILRGTSDEAEKDAIYNDFSKSAWESVKEVLEPYYKKFNGSYPQFDSSPLGVNLDAAVANLLNTNIPLVKLLSFLCNFLDGKEINELLSAYIHKFESIQSLINVLKELGETVTFTDKYALFNSNNTAGNIANQLRFLVSIGKMKGDLSDVKRPLFKAAIEMLGVPTKIEKDEKERAADYFFIGEKWCEANDWIDNFVMKKDGDEVRKGKDANGKDIGSPLAFKNWIKQIIESRRFLYLARYTKPQTVRAVMSNKTLVHYVLSRYAEIGQSHNPNSVHKSQIDKYYRYLPSYKDNQSRDIMVSELTDYLVKYSFAGNILPKKKNIIFNAKSTEKNLEIKCLKELTGLYLYVAFQAIKHIVKINARYYIAFAAWERDYHFFREKLNKPVDDKDFPEENKKIVPPRYANYFAMTEYLLGNTPKPEYEPEPGKFSWKEFRAMLKADKKNEHFTGKWRKILRRDIDTANEIDKGLQSWARNQAAHLNVLTALPKYIAEFSPRPMSSYFQLYHYILQRRICDATEVKLCGLPEMLAKFHSPCKDFIKYCYVSLAYNLPRYKNLTIEELFEEQ